MHLVRQRAFARAGLMGNPSDAYGGKTLSVIVRNFWAEAVLYEWDEVELVLSQEDHTRFASVDELLHDVRQHGYYGGIRLVKATIKRFAEYCRAQGLELRRGPFAVRYTSNIPRQVGLAGSSAIAVAVLRCLMEYYGVSIPAAVQASLVLAVETEELGIAAGLQDRVVQVYEGLVYMDFSPQAMHVEQGFRVGRYEPLPCELLPPLYIAYTTRAPEPTEVTHSSLRARWEAGDPQVRAAMRHLAELTDAARTALLQRDHATLARLMNENFDTRLRIMQPLAEHVQMVYTARAAGCSAKFAGSGGAIVGTYPDDEAYDRLQRALQATGCRVFRPLVAQAEGGTAASQATAATD
jgi:glucuronokinase